MAAVVAAHQSAVEKVAKLIRQRIERAWLVASQLACAREPRSAPVRRAWVRPT